jgi:uncharacterized protein YjiS (DUF1127 family)
MKFQPLDQSACSKTVSTRTALPWVVAMNGVLRLPTPQPAAMGTIAAHRPAAMGFGGGFRRVWAGVVRAMELMAARRALLAMDDRMLKDLGISRAQAEFEATRSAWHKSAAAFPLHEDSWR